MLLLPSAIVKYKVPFQDCESDCDCLKKENKKLMVVDSLKCYTKKTNQFNFLEFYKVHCKCSVKKDDLPDAFYIASYNK